MEGKPQGEASSVAVLRARRLEIVDEEGKVRAVLGTHDNGSVGLDVLDNANKVRASFGVADDPEKSVSGVQFFDADGKMRANMSVHNDPEKVVSLSILDGDEKVRVGMGLRADGQAGLSVSAGEKDRSLKLSALPDGKLYLALTGEGAPMIGLSLDEQEGKDPSANLALGDKDGRGGVVISGRKSRSLIHFRDHRGRVRAGLVLGDDGELEATSYGPEERSARRGDWRSNFLRAFLVCMSIVGGAFLSAWVAGQFSNAASGTQAGPGLYFFLWLAIVISVFIAALVAFLDYLRR